MAEDLEAYVMLAEIAGIIFMFNALICIPIGV